MIDLLDLGISQEEAKYKALAYFLFREIIEEAHSKYRIPNAEIKRMCKMAVNRAKFYIDTVVNGSALDKTAFLTNACFCSEWDKAEVTQDIKDIEKMHQICRKALLEAALRKDD